MKTKIQFHFARLFAFALTLALGAQCAWGAIADASGYVPKLGITFNAQTLANDKGSITVAGQTTPVSGSYVSGKLGYALDSSVSGGVTLYSESNPKSGGLSGNAHSSSDYSGVASPFAISTYAKLGTTPNSLLFHVRCYSDGTGVYVYLDDTGKKLMSYWSNTSNGLNTLLDDSDGSVGFDEWHHYVMTADRSGRVLVYVDGELKTTLATYLGANGGNRNLSDKSYSALHIGGYSTTFTSSSIIFDDIRFYAGANCKVTYNDVEYDAALDDAAVVNLYKSFALSQIQWTTSVENQFLFENVDTYNSATYWADGTPASEILGASASTKPDRVTQGSRTVSGGTSHFIELSHRKNANQGLTFISPSAFTSATEYKLEFYWFASGGYASRKSGLTVQDSDGNELFGVALPVVAGEKTADVCKNGGDKLGSITYNRATNPETPEYAKYWYHFTLIGSTDHDVVFLTVKDSSENLLIDSASLGRYAAVGKIGVLVASGTNGASGNDWYRVYGGMDDIVFSNPLAADAPGIPVISVTDYDDAGVNLKHIQVIKDAADDTNPTLWYCIGEETADNPYQQYDGTPVEVPNSCFVYAYAQNSSGRTYAESLYVYSNLKSETLNTPVLTRRGFKALYVNADQTSVLRSPTPDIVYVDTKSASEQVVNSVSSAVIPLDETSANVMSVTAQHTAYTTSETATYTVFDFLNDNCDYELDFEQDLYAFVVENPRNSNYIPYSGSQTIVDNITFQPFNGCGVLGARIVPEYKESMSGRSRLQYSAGNGLFAYNSDMSILLTDVTAGSVIYVLASGCAAKYQASAGADGVDTEANGIQTGKPQEYWFTVTGNGNAILTVSNGSYLRAVRVYKPVGKTIEYADTDVTINAGSLAYAQALADNYTVSLSQEQQDAGLQPSYYKVVAKASETAGTYNLVVVLDEEVVGVSFAEDESTEAAEMTVEEGNVKSTFKLPGANVKKGLYYGVGTVTDPEGTDVDVVAEKQATADGETISLSPVTLDFGTGNVLYYKWSVSDTPQVATP